MAATGIPAPLTFRYDVADDVPLELDIYLPQHPSSSSNGAALIFFHGGGLVGNNLSHISPYLVEAPLARGWPVVSIDYRLLPQVDGEAIRQDIISAWRFIVDELPSKLPAFKIDPLRLTAAGQSAGGYLAYLAGAHCHPRPAAVFSIYGISTFNDPFFVEKVQLNKYPLKRADLAHHLDSPSVIAGDDSIFVAPSDAPDAADLSGLDRPRTKLDRPALYDYFVQEGRLPAVVGDSRDLDPLQLLDASFPPTITLHGTGDRLVPHYMSRKVVETLKAFGVEAHQFEVEGVDHGFEVFSHAYDRPGSKIWSTYLEKPFLALDRIYGRWNEFLVLNLLCVHVCEERNMIGLGWLKSHEEHFGHQV